LAFFKDSNESFENSLSLFMFVMTNENFLLHSGHVLDINAHARMQERQKASRQAAPNRKKFSALKDEMTKKKSKCNSRVIRMHPSRHAGLAEALFRQIAHSSSNGESSPGLSPAPASMLCADSAVVMLALARFMSQGCVQRTTVGSLLLLFQGGKNRQENGVLDGRIGQLLTEI